MKWNELVTLNLNHRKSNTHAEKALACLSTQTKFDASLIRTLLRTRWKRQRHTLDVSAHSRSQAPSISLRMCLCVNECVVAKQNVERHSNNNINNSSSNKKTKTKHTEPMRVFYFDNHRNNLIFATCMCILEYILKHSVRVRIHTHLYNIR